MKTTQSAHKWIQVSSQIVDNRTLAVIIQKAQQIAKDRQSPRLGKNHLELALEKLGEET